MNETRLHFSACEMTLVTCTMPTANRRLSAYARKHFIDHQTLSHDAYVKFIEDDFLRGRRLDPGTDGRPDPRQTVAENAPQLGDLRNDFDFTQAPRRPLLLPGGVGPPYKPGYTGPP